MIPLKDYNPTRRFPYVTVLLIVLNVGVYFLIQRPFSSTAADDAKFSYQYAAIPCEVVTGRALTTEEIVSSLNGNDSACQRDAHPRSTDEEFPNKSVWLSIIYSMFLHGSLLHIGGNMLYLWIFGNNIEDRMGPLPYVAFYLVAGVAAAAAHILVQPNSSVPIVGASGAIAGVMGAYLVLFPDVPIRTLLIFLLVFIRDIKAKWLLGFWFVLQFFTGSGSGVAWVAHVGGFAFGAVIAFLLRDKLRPSRVAIEAY